MYWFCFILAGDDDTKKAVKVDAAKGATTLIAVTIDENVVDEKIWADVDKDLGELLQAVSTDTANDDEDEDSTTTTER